MLCTGLQNHLGSKSYYFRECDKVKVLCIEKHKAPYMFTEHPQNSQVQTFAKTLYKYKALFMVHVQGTKACLKL